MQLTPQNLHDIGEHAKRAFPDECCGLIVDGVYMPCFNYASDPKNDFSIPAATQIQIRSTSKTVEAVVHSHPNGPFYPSDIDMQGQIDSGVPWVLVATDGVVVSPPQIWGADTPVPAIIGRSFMHGVTDCYSLIRDIFRLGKVELAKQTIVWPLDPILIPEFARADAWWGDVKRPKQKLYEDNFMKAGFRKIAREDVKPGDCFMMRIRSETLNHAGALCGDDMILHHLPGRLSRREPAGIWARAADQWVRYEAPNA